ncbi:hypothetical protein COEREDRAFT_88830 [Coemansia reversa NRRL 1564]|uniref:PEX14-like helix-turn-helix domain-containing protein n=1 Tax=Coemansia reversa (strain ATCC 12441 / NRRL 1564) TaxID=763665 RepID=A0A2G5B5K3_COERN|nr:hypothetical protein COEREDRAFT_88830 [Coemansia reversa NRRL 1564]|eukprot:PIA14323.1 hypothetical protein COEREDRAFT_88830 [Coemansia reversa NRRL 1564]
MSTKITQVDGCTFSTAELQQFHCYYKFDWQAVGLSNATAGERIDYFTDHVDSATDSRRLREWLRTMGIVNESDKTEETRRYERFEQYDYGTAPGFNQLVAEVYEGNNVDKHTIDERMERAKAKYYGQHVEPVNYDEYRRFKAQTAPKAACPYQHLWENDGTDKKTAQMEKFSNVKTIDIGAVLGADGLLTVSAMNGLLDIIKEAHDKRYYAAAMINSRSSGNLETQTAEFLPMLSVSSSGAEEVLKAATQVQIELRRLNKSKPLMIFADGTVDASAVGILLSTVDIMLSERFAIRVGPGNTSSQKIPLAALHDWAHLSENHQANAPAGTAEYILCNPSLVLYSSEWMGLGLASGFVGQRKYAAAVEKILLAASCPPPHTRDALRKACAAESAYPGPSKLSVWEQEIRQHFAPLSSSTQTAEDLANKLRCLNKPWADIYATFADEERSRAVAEVRIAGLRAARTLEYSQTLALEISAGVAWAKGVCDPHALFDGSSITVAAGGLPSSGELESAQAVPDMAAAALSEISSECPFARMYRKNPERFKHIDLQAIAKHRSLNL